MGATADTFMMVKADFILPNHILIMDYLAKQNFDNTCGWNGKREWQECIFKIKEIEANQEELKDEEILSDYESIKPDKRNRITEEEGPILKIIERRVYEENRHVFPYYNWKAFEISKIK